MAERCDVLVAEHPSNRAAFSAFTAVRTSSARTDLLEAAYVRALPLGHPARDDVARLINAFGKFGARRNEIAHGRVYDLDEHGYFLGPNNVMPHKWTDEGSAKYQYTSEDVAHYVDCFLSLLQRAKGVVAGLKFAAETKATRSRHDERDRRT